MREWVMPIFVVAVGLVAMLFTYPYETLTALTIAYLSFIPVSWRNFRDRIEQSGSASEPEKNPATAPQPETQTRDAQTSSAQTSSAQTSRAQTSSGRIFTLRPPDPPGRDDASAGE